MNFPIKLFLLVLVNVLAISEVQGNYTIYIYVASQPFSGSSAINYMTLTGSLGISPVVNINTFPNGSVNANLLGDSKIAVISNLFPNDYGYINTVNLGNKGVALTMQALNILDVMRNVWSNMSFSGLSGYIMINSNNNFYYPVNGNWSNWSNWGSCSVTCGTGNMTRQRTCTNPPPANTGAQCPDSNIQIQTCTNVPCPINGGWCQWSAWSACSATCGSNAIASTSRACDCPQPQYNGTMCSGGPALQTKPCNVNVNCQVQGTWGNWSDWTACSTTCGNGTQIKSRNCSVPETQNLGTNCVGSNQAIQICSNNPQCPIDGQWTSWGNWSACSITCGLSGTQQRSRTCSNPSPAFGGKQCPGSTTDSQACANIPANCPVNGGWSSWSDWSQCSVTCNTGNQIRIRSCSSPAAMYGGLPCSSCTTMTGGVCGMTDTVSQNCSTNACIDLTSQAQNVISNVLSQINLNNTNSTLSVQQTMQIAFQAVNVLQNLLQSQLGNTTAPVMIETKVITVGLLNIVPGGNMTMTSADKGGIALNSNKNFSSGTVASFSALKSSSFFSKNSSQSISAAMLSMTLSNVTNTTNTPIVVSLPNLNPPVTNQLMSPVTFLTSGKIIQYLQYSSQYTLYKISMDLTNVTDFTILFASLSTLPNTSATADAFIYISNNTMNSTNVNIQTSAAWDNVGFQLQITIPSMQIMPGNNLTLIMSTTTNNSSGNVSIMIGVTSITPTQWNYDMEVWQDSDAEIGDTSDINNVNFKSNFLGTFSAKIFIAPNAIDFKSVFANFASNLANSFVVLLVIIIIIILYLILVFFLWRKDRREASLLRYEPLLDNGADHEYSYIISVHTSSCGNAGTSSDVFLNLLGKWGSSGHRKLTDGYRTKLFSYGTVCNFVMTTDMSLGELLALRVWHNSSGITPSWHLEKIIIEDIQTNKMYIFMCDTWLSECKFDGNAERVLLELKRDKKFQALFYRMKVTGVMDKHIISGITKNTGISSYTRVQKVSVFITMFFLIMVSNAMFFGKDANLTAEANFTIDLGIISLTWFQIYTGIISVAITYPILFLVSEIFRRTKRWKRRWTVDKEAQMKKIFQFPRWFLFIGWFLLCLALFAAAFFTFLYSLQWGGAKSNQWLESFFVGVIGMVFISDPIILIIIFILARKLLGAVSTDQEVNIDEFVNEDIKKVLGANTKEPEQEKLDKIKKDKESAKKLSNTIEDALTYVLSVFLLTALAYSARDQTTFQQTNVIRNRFINLSASISTFNDIYPWAMNILNETYPSKWYNGMKRTGDLSNAIYICDCQRQGPFRLRQLRVLNSSCALSSYITPTFSNLTCNDYYNLFTEDTNSYSISWNPLAKSNLSLNVSNWNRQYVSPTQSVINAFVYQNASISGGYPFDGKFATYEGGGYVATLGMKASQAAYVIRNLQTQNWLDRLTRAVFFEGTVYNGNTNLFTTIQVLFEQPSSGGMFMFGYGVRSYRLYDYLPGNMIVLLAMQVCYGLTVLLNIYREAKKMHQLKCSYFKSNWNKVEVLSIMLSLGIIICMTIRIMVTIDNITKLNVNKGYYVSFDTASTWLETTCVLMAFSCFISIIRVLKYMGFNKYISIMQGTLFHACTQLSSLGFMFICFVMAFVAIGHILFSLNNVRFSSIGKTITSLFGVIIPIVKYNQMFEVPMCFVTAIYYNIWAAVAIFFITTVFVCILCDTYEEIVEEETYCYDKDMVEHMWSRVNEIITGFKSSMKYTVPDIMKKKAIEPVDMSDIDMQMSSRDNVRLMSNRKLNPSVRRKIAELNGDKFENEEIERRPESENDIYISPISFTDIKIASTGSQMLDDDTFASRLPRYRAKGNRDEGLDNSLSILDPIRPMKPNPKIEYILQKRRQSRQNRTSKPKP